MHREGFVVEFSPVNSASWIGSFQRGLSTYSNAILHPDGRSVVIISGGQLYQIDLQTRSLVSKFGGTISDSVKDAAGSLLILSDGMSLWALDASGIRWQTERISWDGIRALSLDDRRIAGEAYDPMKDTWASFDVDLAPGEVSGGSYAQYSISPKT